MQAPTRRPRPPQTLRSDPPPEHRGFRRLLALCALLWGAAAWAQPPVDGTAAELKRGAQLAAEHCAGCHGAQGQSLSAAFPRLAGQNPKYLSKQLRDFASGRRQSAIMKDKAALLNEDAIAALVAHYSRQRGDHTPTDDALLAGVGRFIYERGNAFAGLPACLACHGSDARGTAELPRLAGQHPAYLEAQLRLFAQRARSNDNAIMNVVASRLSELELKAVADYLGSLP